MKRFSYINSVSLWQAHFIGSSKWLLLQKWTHVQSQSINLVVIAMILRKISRPSQIHIYRQFYKCHLPTGWIFLFLFCEWMCSPVQPLSFTGSGRNIGITKWSMTLFPDSTTSHENESVPWQPDLFPILRGHDTSGRSLPLRTSRSLIRPVVFAEGHLFSSVQFKGIAVFSREVSILQNFSVKILVLKFVNVKNY